MRSRRSALFVALVALATAGVHGCAHGPFVVYGPEEGVVGYRVVYMDAIPKPGTAIHQGATQAFSVDINYMLVARDKGEVVLEFTDTNGYPILDDRTVRMPISRGTMRPATITQEIVVPKKLLDVVLRIGVVPEGVHQPGGWLEIRYPTTK